MRKDVVAFSRHQHLVLYDPAAVPADTPVDPDLDAQDPQLLPASAVESLAERGLAVVLRIADEDCEANIRLVIDEEADDYVRKRAVPTLDGATLHIPSGKLTVDGLEFLCRPGESRKHSEAEVMEIPAGDYRAEVLNLIPWKARHRAGEIETQTTRFERVVGRLVTAYTWLGILLLPANVLLFPVALLIVWKESGWQRALKLAAAMIAIEVLVVAGFWALDFASRWVPALTRRSDVTRAFEAENPDVVVCLKRLADSSEMAIPGMATLALE